MIKKLFVLFFVFAYSFADAQTVKTDILVIGGNPAGTAAAMQSARSKIKTALVAEGNSLGNFKAGETFSGTSLPSGIWGEFEKQMAGLRKNPSDVTVNATAKFNSEIAASILNKMTDTVKNLTIYYGSSFSNIKKDGSEWELVFTKNGKTLKVITRVIIDATDNAEVAVKAGAKPGPALANILKNLGENSYRTSIAADEDLPGQQYGSSKNIYPPYPAFCVPMESVIAQGRENILAVGQIFPCNDIRYLPFQLELGQGAGAVAAYCVFFKTTTKNLRVRTIQGELLNFKACLLPFADVPNADRDWRDIQQVCATGLLRGVQVGNNPMFMFRPDSIISTAEIRPVMTELYSRAFLWFAREKPGNKFTLGNLLSFISDYTLTEPVILKGKVQRDWKTVYKFDTGFELNRPLTRREFAVLANRYINPFSRTVDLSGRVVN